MVIISSNNKSQVTLAIILVIVLLAGTSILLYYLKGSFSVTASTSNKAEDVNSYITNCVSTTLENGIKTASLRGGTSNNGMITEMNPALNTSIVNKPSSNADAELFVSNYIKEHLNDCLDNYRSFDSKGVRVVSGEIKNVEVSINNQDTSVTVTFPIKVISGSKTTTIEKFQASKPSELIRMLEKEKNTFANEEIDMTYLGSTRQNTTVLD